MIKEEKTEAKTQTPLSAVAKSFLLAITLISISPFLHIHRLDPPLSFGEKDNVHRHMDGMMLSPSLAKEQFGSLKGSRPRGNGSKEKSNIEKNNKGNKKIDSKPSHDSLVQLPKDQIKFKIDDDFDINEVKNNAGDDVIKNGDSNVEDEEEEVSADDLVSEEEWVDQISLFEIELGDFLIEGSVNFCHIKLPSWWYDEFDDENEYIMKYTTKKHEKIVAEINTMTTLWTDAKRAGKLRIIPMESGNAQAFNPFYQGFYPPKKIPDSWGKKQVTELREPRFLSAIIVPSADRYEELEVLDSLARTRSFMRSLLETLSYAHSLGVTLFDVSTSNIRVDTEDDSAIIVNWNAGKALGDDIYEPDANFYQTPPEAMIEHVDGKKIQQTSLSAFDVWASGVLFAQLLFRDSGCTWINPETHKKRKEYPEWNDYLKTLVLSFGGDTHIPISDDVGDKVDLASLVGVKKRDMVDGKKTIQFPIFKSDTHGKQVNCETTKLPNATGSKRLQMDAMSFLKSMMIINPAHRPTCDELLSHPFMQIED